MKDNNLDRMSIIHTDKLDAEHYFQSLLEQAHAKGLLYDTDIERLQYECLNLLAYKTEQYNAGDSSSIRVEKAQAIMTSNLYTIGIGLKTYKNPDDAVTTLMNESVKELYRKGRQRIDSMLTSAKSQYQQLLLECVNANNSPYQTLIEINSFFKQYDLDFAAHEIHISAQYSDYNAKSKLVGIEFIQAYLLHLHNQQQKASE